MPSIARLFEFDAAHRVLGHESKCRFLHGHRYKVELTVDAPRLDGLGRVIDFGMVKQVVGKWIDENLDHNILLHPDDPFTQLHQIETYPEHEAGDWGVVKRNELYGREPYVMPNGNPTAENIAEAIFAAAVDLLYPIDQKLRVTLVRVWETPNCYADCTGLPPAPVMDGRRTEEFFRTAPPGATAVSSLPPKALADAAKRSGLKERGLTMMTTPDGRTGKIRVQLVENEEQFKRELENRPDDEPAPSQGWTSEVLTDLDNVLKQIEDSTGFAVTRVDGQKGPLVAVGKTENCLVAGTPVRKEGSRFGWVLTGAKAAVPGEEARGAFRTLKELGLLAE